MTIKHDLHKFLSSSLMCAHYSLTIYFLTIVLAIFKSNRCCKWMRKRNLGSVQILDYFEQKFKRNKQGNCTEFPEVIFIQKDY
ncbi:CLUMA_CG003880, isoform A [Clunio marinus]|uniref:CLUMA_CG003880, isoform A n=1 Tax=Clunio marinus TaxID=568069 RepID=A0A1J1HQ47_9DIPT|nr:CLUMA_CG003880, isoform A [Clunio marinus]